MTYHLPTWEAIPFLVTTTFVLSRWVWEKFKAGVWRHVLWERAQKLHVGILSGTVDGPDLLRNRMRPDGQIIGWVEMVQVYQKYMNDLPLQKRHEVIDKLLQNQAIRCKGHYTDIQTLIDMMNSAEIETLAYTMGVEFNSIDDRGHQIREVPRPTEGLANEVILFRFRNPY